MNAQPYPLGEVTARDAAKWGSIAASATAAASAGGSAALLTTLGVSAQLVPVVGQIAGAVLLITGIILKAQAKAKGTRNNIAEVESQQADYRLQLVELDQLVAQSDASKANIMNELHKLGVTVNGLDGFSDWLKKTFTPGNYYGNILNDAKAELARLESEVKQRISYLEQTRTQLIDLYDTLTGAKIKRALLWGGGIALGLTGLYFLNQHYKWIKL